jgi:hypothetical protein
MAWLCEGGIHRFARQRTIAFFHFEQLKTSWGGLQVIQASGREVVQARASLAI